MGSIYISWVIAREWDMTYLPNIAGVVKWWSVQVETAKHSATRCLLNGTFTTHNFVVKWLQYCTISINSNVTHHTQFFLTPDLIFSRFFRFSEIFRKRGKVTCCSNWTKWYSNLHYRGYAKEGRRLIVCFDVLSPLHGPTLDSNEP